MNRAVVIAGVSLVALLATIDNASAGELPYYVATSTVAFAGNADFPLAVSDYNYDSSGFRGPYGSYMATGNCGGAGCSVGTSGTNSSNPLLTTVSSTANASNASPGFTGTATATANLSTGAVGVYADGEGQIGGYEAGQGVASSFMQDLVTLHGLPAGNSNVVVTYTIHGTLSANSTSGGSASLRVINGFGGGVIDTIVEDAAYTGYSPALDYFNQSGWVNIPPPSINDSDLGNMVFTADYQVNSSDPVVGMTMYVTVNCSGGATCNYDDTDSISLTLPPGVTFTSDSGVLLSAAAAVPEPADWTVLLVAGGALGFLLRRRTHG